MSIYHNGTCDEVIKKTMWFVNSGSYRRGKGYAIQKNFPPEELGCPIVELHGGKKNKKNHSFTW